MNKYKELQVWQKAVELAVTTHKITANFPKDERYELTSQIRRSAVSVSSNIAEGAGRNSDNEFKHFLGIAVGSAFELETQLIISEKLGLVSEVEVRKPLEELTSIQNMLFGLQRALKNKN